MTARLTARMTVDALRRRVTGAGGFAAVLARGDEIAGAILLVLVERGEPRAMLEHVSSLDGGRRWTRTGPQQPASPESQADYLARRRRSDPDLWVVELDIPDAERFIAESSGVD